jgi:RNA polymerase sigma-70 factor (ECF subfamily)
MPSIDEVDLVERACRMERAAIGALYRRHVQAIYRYVYYRVGDEHMAEDLTAEVFLRVIEALPNYQQRGVPFAAWLYRIARARTADHHRRHRRLATSGLDEQWPSDEDPPLRLVEQSTRHEDLRAALGHLTTDQQQVVVLKFAEGFSNADVARILGKTEGAVKSLQHRALDALHRLMESSNGKRRT